MRETGHIGEQPLHIVSRNLLRIRDDKLPKGFDPDLKHFLESHDCLNSEGELRYGVVEANDLIFLVDTREKHKKWKVFPYHDEATDIAGVAESVMRSRKNPFPIAVDSFCGGGNSGLPIVARGYAKQLIGCDVNPRALQLARTNAAINDLGQKTKFVHKDAKKSVVKRPEETLYIANAPFALAVKGIPIDIMRDGGEDGLQVLQPFIKNALKVAKSGDVICGVAYSRIAINGDIEVKKVLNRLVESRGAVTISFLEGRTLWRESDGKKHLMNPMSLSEMHRKSRDSHEKELYNESYKKHLAKGFDRLGYYSYVITLEK